MRRLFVTGFLFLSLTTFGQLHFNTVDFNKPLFQMPFNCHLAIPNNIKSISPIHYELPKGAIFCRMEDALHQRFNLWIKFRMGNDDRYSN